MSKPVLSADTIALVVAENAAHDRPRGTQDVIARLCASHEALRAEYVAIVSALLQERVNAIAEIDAAVRRGDLLLGAANDIRHALTGEQP